MNWIECAKLAVIVNVGQIPEAARRKLDAAARRGEIRKWRGHWWPVPGAASGIGPLKTCYGPMSAKVGEK